MKPRRETKSITVHRDGEVYAIGLNRKQAETLVAECSTAYPENNFSIASGGVAKPGSKEKK